MERQLNFLKQDNHIGIILKTCPCQNYPCLPKHKNIGNDVLETNLANVYVFMCVWLNHASLNWIMWCVTVV